MRFFISFEDKNDERELKEIAYRMNHVGRSYSTTHCRAIIVEDDRIDGGKKCCKVESFGNKDCFLILLGKYYSIMLRDEGVKIYDANGNRCLTKKEQDELSPEEKKLLPILTFELAA